MAKENLQLRSGLSFSLHQQCTTTVQMFRIAMPQTIGMSREHGLPIYSECLSLSLSALGAPSCTGFVFFLLRLSPFVFFLLLFQCVVFRGRSSSVKPIISSQCRRFSSSLWLPMLLQLSSSRGLTPPHWVSGAWTTAVMYVCMGCMCCLVCSVGMAPQDTP